ncbi:MAG TPA: methyltransferase domain-containing protein, partial [Thermoanaerobaculia bacterium]|nr:methyltransferase domain-containing protein [Thermoanaerobaculia bacterium]
MSAPGAPPLSTGEAYRLWAETYDEENPLSTLDALAVSFLTPPLAGASLLDAACGTARRLVFHDGVRPARAFGADLVFEMLHRGRRDARRPRGTAAADLGALPFPAARFAVVWCRLASGHLPRLAPLYRELARVLLPDGRAVVTDFHPEAIRAGHRRIFRDAGGRSREVMHVVHEAAAHEREAASAGLAFEARLEYGIGGEVR